MMGRADTRSGQAGARGQSTLEYILVLAAIVAAVALAAGNQIQPAVEKTMTDVQQTIESASGQLASGLGLPTGSAP